MNIAFIFSQIPLWNLLSRPSEGFMANITLARVAIVTELGRHTTSFLIILALLNVFVDFLWRHQTVDVHSQISFQLGLIARNVGIVIGRASVVVSGSYGTIIWIHRNPFYCPMLLIFNISGLVPILQPADLLLLPVQRALINLLWDLLECAVVASGSAARRILHMAETLVFWTRVLEYSHVLALTFWFVVLALFIGRVLS